MEEYVNMFLGLGLWNVLNVAGGREWAFIGLGSCFSHMVGLVY